MGTPSKKIPSKTFEKPLDKKHKVCYNINVKRTGSKRIWGTCKVMEQTPLTVDKKIFEEISKNLLTKPQKYGIINM